MLPPVFSLADALPTRESIYNTPEKAKLPDDPSARVILLMRELVSFNKKTFDAVMTYMERFPKELQALYLTQLQKSDQNRDVVARHERFNKWVHENHQYF